MGSQKTLKERRKEAEELVLDISTQLEKVEANIQKSIAELKEATKAKAKFQQLVPVINRITNDSKAAIAEFRSERARINRLQKAVDTFYYKKYEPLASKIMDPNSGFKARIRQGDKFYGDIQKMRNDLSKQVTLVRGLVNDSKRKLANANKIESSITKIYDQVLEDKSTITEHRKTIEESSLKVGVALVTDPVQPTRIYYDVLDRKTKVRMPDNSTTEVSYDFGNDAFGQKQFMQTTTDANGISFKSFVNAMGKQTTLKAPHQAITKFVYDPLGQLLNSTDPEANSTIYTYDNLGQLVQRVHPDAGTTKYHYDGAGNLRSVKTANLISQGDSIYYNYSYNRLKEVRYPNNPENDVYYEYGDNSSGNQTGRLTKLQDASGTQTFKYGKMGELVKNIHTFVMPQGQTYSFAMKWTYDSWNRTQDITYPDGEVVTYDYDNAGQLQAMRSAKGSNNYAIIDSISYDRFGSRAKIRYGNGTRSTYTYESQLHRLSQLKSYDANNALMQNIEYSYNASGNINEIENTATAISGMGGVYDYTYDYDSLYRLVNSDGSFTDFGGTDYTYDLDMQFSASGSIQSKSLLATNLINGTSNSISYSRNYSYNTNQPHTVHDIDGLLEMQWDANGNMTQFEDLGNLTVRNLCWDEENRLTTVRDEQNLSSYIYNAGGERVWKITGEVDRMYINGSQYVDNVNLNHKTLYTSPYMVVSDQEYTKHYYAGSQRVLTKLGGGMANNIVDPIQYQISFNGNYDDIKDGLWTMMQRGFTCSGIDVNNVWIDDNFPIIDDNINLDNVENDQYFYHTDHLGSSSWITDNVGDVNQHLQYLPFGESFIDQRYTGHDIRFKFTTKEENIETGYQYFGARYYESDLSIWLSVDPLASKYPSMSPYMYVAGNPVMLVDPDGNDVIPTNILKANSSVYSIFKLASENKVYRNVMKSFYKNQNHVYVHLAQLKDEYGNPSGFTNTARTQSNLSANNPVAICGIHRIIINSDLLSSDGVLRVDKTFVFRALLHEAIHARMYEKYKQGEFVGYPGYGDFMSRGRGGHHNQMAAFNRQELIDGMIEFDNQLRKAGEKVPAYHNNEWYEAMSWYGLRKTQAWRDLKRDNPQKAALHKKIIKEQVIRNRKAIRNHG